MKRTMQILALLLALVFSVTDRALAVDVYVLTNSTIGSGAASTSFGTINTSSGAYTEIASLTGDIWNLVWNPSDGNFWVTDGYSTATT